MSVDVDCVSGLTPSRGDERTAPIEQCDTSTADATVDRHRVSPRSLACARACKHSSRSRLELRALLLLRAPDCFRQLKTTYRSRSQSSGADAANSATPAGNPGNAIIKATVWASVPTLMDVTWFGFICQRKQMPRIENTAAGGFRTTPPVQLGVNTSRMASQSFSRLGSDGNPHGLTRGKS
jgi:hypothetical protein